MGVFEPLTISRFIGGATSDHPPYPFEVLLAANETRPAESTGRPAPIERSHWPIAAPDFYRNDILNQSIDVLMNPGRYGTRISMSTYSPEGEASKQALQGLVRVMDSRQPRTI